MHKFIRDIENRADLEFLLSAFYGRLLEDPQMRHIFIDVAQIEMQEHLPVIVDFWEQILFQASDYKKNVLKLHIDLNQKVTLTAENFKTWLQAFEQTVDANFRGEVAENAKTRALSIATIMQIKLQAP